MRELHRDSLFFDRTEAGIALGRAVARRISAETPAIVLALPRGGVPVAVGVAGALAARLDIFLVRKLGTPGHEELAFGAIASGGVQVLNHAVVEKWRIAAGVIEEVAKQERAELERRERIYRAGRPALAVQGRVAVLVDDGLATGATMLAAIRSIRLLHPSRVMVAAPVASREAFETVRASADEAICLETPAHFYAVGACYRQFDQVSDGEVCGMLQSKTPASF